MEAEQRRSKRKPLSDCTNTLQNRRKNASSSSKIPKSQTLIKPPKPFNSAANIVSNKQSNPNSSTCSSPKSNTSTGSNNWQSVPSIPQSPEPPAPHTPLSDADGKKSRLSADQLQRHDVPATRKDKGKMVADAPATRKDKGKMVADSPTTRKDKGKMVADAPIIQSPASLTSNFLKISSSAPAHCSHFEVQSVQNENRHTQTLKDKGEAIVDAPVVESPSSWTSKYLHSSSLFTSDDSLFNTSAAYSQELLVKKRKYKGIMILEPHNAEASESEPSTPHAPHASHAASDGKKSRLSADQLQRHDAPATRKDKGKMVADAPATRKDKGKMVADAPATRKDKGKMVADAPIIQSPASLTSNSLKISSSAPAHCSHFETQSVQIENRHTQTLKDKGEAIVDAPVVESPSSWTSKYLHSSSLFTSDDSLSNASAAYSQELLVQKRKDKGIMILEPHNAEASEFEPSTPHAPHASHAASGTHERPLTIYTQRRPRPEGGKHATGKISESLTCPPGQRIKKKGLELDYDQAGINSGSHTDPLPMRKKKRSREKYGDPMHVLPKEEVEKLRAMYADIDAFELPEEVVSESELE